MSHNHDDSSGDNDTDPLADAFEQDRSDETTGNTGVFGQVGTGKTHRFTTELARRLTDETEPTEWIDPKGESIGEGEENGE